MAQEIVDGDIIEIGESYKDFCWNIAIAKLIVTVCALGTIQIFCKFPLFQVPIFS